MPSKRTELKRNIGQVSDDLYDEGLKTGLWQGLCELRTLVGCIKMLVHGTEETKAEYQPETLLTWGEDQIGVLQEKINRIKKNQENK